MLGARLYFGDGIAKDKSRAAELFQDLVDLKHPVAAFILGYMYSTGDGVQEDEMRGAALVQLSNSKGVEMADIYLARRKRGSRDLDSLSCTLIKQGSTWTACMAKCGVPVAVEPSNPIRAEA